MTLAEMVTDFCRRNKNRYTPEQVAEYAQTAIPYFDEYGFFVLTYIDPELRVDFMYIAPGAPRSVARDYERRVKQFARDAGAKYIQFISRRKGLNRIFPDFTPVATVYETEVLYDEQDAINRTEPDAEHDAVPGSAGAVG